MEVHTNISLKNYVTMKLGGNARFMVDIRTTEDLRDICEKARQQSLPVHVLGGGSNTIVSDKGYDGIILRMRIMGCDILSDANGKVQFRVGAGENWDEFVKKTVDMKLTGIEALSAIPGTVGAAPVQNIGAYGQEVAETIISLEAYDTQSGELRTLASSDCGFSYRNSIFRSSEVDRYVITSVTFELMRATPTPPFYKAVQSYLDERGTTIYTPQVIRDAVTAIRKDKLPDPSVQPNTGSFFKNAIVEDWQYQNLLDEYPDIPSYDMPDKTHKIPTGWLIEQAGLKGETIQGIKIHDKNALVLINESATSYADLATARDTIVGAVRDKFRIQIEQEPLEI